MRIGLSVLSIVVALAGCSKTGGGQPAEWSSLQLQGKTLDLIDDDKVETYRFHDQGLVAVTLGAKGGPVTAPLFYWRINGNVLVISEMPDQQDLEALGGPTVQGDVVTVSRKSGARARYRLAKSYG